jgi:hypothetical protein
MTTLLCPKHGDPRDTSVMRPKDAPCSCKPKRCDACFRLCGDCQEDDSGNVYCFECVYGPQPDTDEATQDALTNGEYTFMEHLRVFYPKEYERRINA